MRTTPVDLIQSTQFIDTVIFAHLHEEKGFQIHTSLSNINLYCVPLSQTSYKAIEITVTEKND